MIHFSLSPRWHFAALCLLSIVPAAWACSPEPYNIPKQNESAGETHSETGGGGTSAGGSKSTRGGTNAGGTLNNSSTGGSTTHSSGALTDCSSDADCKGSPTLTTCDVANRACVECLPGGADCSAGLYCGNDKLCHLGCGVDLDCGKGTCDTKAHQCVGCSSEVVCPVGTQCDLNQGRCLPACSETANCPTNFTCCANTCVNLQHSNEHCGACSQTCNRSNASMLCANGICEVAACENDHADCNASPIDGCEVDLQADGSHCGSCLNSCANTQVCKSGSCSTPTCGEGFADCDGNANNGCETNLNRDPKNCGACAAACSTANGTPSCDSGTCSITCASGFDNCDGNANNGCETPLANSLSNCGRCSLSCGNNNGSSDCIGGKCQPTCGTGFGDCDGIAANGCESNLLNDPKNCSTCGNICVLPHAEASCTSSKCTIATCRVGFADCNGLPEDGCEANLLTDAVHCGSCASVCSAQNGVSTCAAGSCTITCSTGFANCDLDFVNGCEVDLTKSILNCGTCSNRCADFPNATATCRSGLCVPSGCSAPFGDCDGNSGNGCESNRMTDAGNCGGCGVACVLPNAVPNCQNGTCGIASCNVGFADCNGIATDGCETNLATSLDHCGGCGAACVPANGLGACFAGVCSIKSCANGYADCDHVPSNGCEVDTLTNKLNCGGCNLPCSTTHGTPTCAEGTCNIACKSGYANCDDSVTNGCETSTTDDENHCGSCQTTCAPKSASGTCTGSACVIQACDTGFFDCDGAYTTGCEVNTTADPNHCGSCTNSCSSNGGSASCSSSACAISCNPGFANCDGSLVNGCETNTQTDKLHCGGCNQACGTSCEGGVCAKPCTGICSAPISFTLKGNFVSPQLGSGVACFETTSSIASGGCSNLATGRNLYVNQVAMNCGGWSNLPAPRNGGYCISTDSGNYTYATFTAW